MYRMLAFCILFMMAFCFTTGVNYLPMILQSKIKYSFQSSSNQTNNKLWMNYLERKLVVMNLPLRRRSIINSFLDFYSRNFRNKFSKEIPTNCAKVHFKELDGLQISIYGQICGLSQGGRVSKCSCIWFVFCFTMHIHVEGIRIM